jgi:hypothetical protein
MNLNELVSGIADFDRWKHPDKIKLFAWFIHCELNQDRFTAADIGRCYKEIHSPQPSSIHPFLTDLEGRKPKQLLRDKRGFFLERTIREALHSKHGQRPVAIRIEKLLMELPAEVPDLAERDFLDEALKCYRVGAFRAAIVMCWNLAYDHLLTYIIKNKLTEFNAQWPVSFQKRNAQARVQKITIRDEFSELKESELLTVCKSAAIISPDVYKIMDEKLDKRNSAAHPSGVTIGQLQAENFIDELAQNVVLKTVV